MTHPPIDLNHVQEDDNLDEMAEMPKHGQEIVFDLRQKVNTDLADAPLCVHLMSPVR